MNARARSALPVFHLTLHHSLSCTERRTRTSHRHKLPGAAAAAAAHQQNYQPFRQQRRTTNTLIPSMCVVCCTFQRLRERSGTRFCCAKSASPTTGAAPPDDRNGRGNLIRTFHVRSGNNTRRGACPVPASSASSRGRHGAATRRLRVARARTEN